jgi:23S rRNA pseudouridine1911/1915/1917 synthase
VSGPTLPGDWAGQRLDRAVARLLRAQGWTLSVRQVRRALRAGRLTVGGRSRAPGERIRGGEAVDLEGFVPPAVAPVAPRPDLVPAVAIVHTGPDWWALSKPAGLPTLPRTEPPDGPSLLSAALALDPAVAEAGPPREGGVVHRLDNGASGVVVVARTPQARARWRRAFSAREVHKTYLARVIRSGPGFEPGQRLAIRGPIETTGGPRVRFHCSESEGPISEIRILWVRGPQAGVRVATDSGARHQVRVHLAAAELPIHDDPLYGPKPFDKPDPHTPFALHAESLRWNQQVVQAPPPSWWPDDDAP